MVMWVSVQQCEEVQAQHAQCVKACSSSTTLPSDTLLTPLCPAFSCFASVLCALPRPSSQACASRLLHPSL